MLFKATMLFQLATGTVAPNPSLRRIGGWSESFYLSIDSFLAAESLINSDSGITPLGLCKARANLLPSSAQIIGQRLQQLNPVGRSQTYSKLWNGASGQDCDVPQMALLTRIPAVGTNNVRPYIIRGIPDVFVVDGEFRPSAGMSDAIRTLFESLTKFSLRTAPTASLPNSILAIDAQGKIIFSNTRPTIAVGGVLNLSGVLASGQTISGPFVVEAIGPETLALSVRGWTYGVATGGQAVTRAISYPALDGTRATIGRIIVKKVGRPFVAYRGRASTRRRRRRAV